MEKRVFTVDAGVGDCDGVCVRIGIDRFLYLLVSLLLRGVSILIVRLGAEIVEESIYSN